MAEELKEKLDADASLIEGSGGVFDVVVDGRKVYAKSDTGRFPKAGEVSRLISS